MFSKLSGRTKTQEIEKPQSFASQLAEQPNFLPMR